MKAAVLTGYDKNRRIRRICDHRPGRDCQAAGIRLMEEAPGFERVMIAPMPDERLGSLEAELHTRNGIIRSSWRFVDGRVRYEITAEMPVTICVNGTKKDMEPGKYTFWG